ncbi:MAG: hypothetical protein H3C40_10800 [Ignavibacterium sp.]|nr:hypothetical protein [Ignavibacterium sp.]
MKINLLIILLILFLLPVNYIPAQQLYVNQNNSIKNLPHDISWQQVLSNSKDIYSVGYKNDDMFLFNLLTGTTIKFEKIKKTKVVFLSSENIYIASMDITENKYIVDQYSYDKKLIKSINIPNQSTITGYFIYPIHKTFYYICINLDNFMSSESNLMISGNVVSSNNFKEIYRFEYEQNAMPTRLTLPIASTYKNKLYFALENNYKVGIFSLKGEKLFEFTNPKFKNKPYTKEEINLLNPIQQSVLEAGKSYPPIIRRIDINSLEQIYITRLSRPGVSNLEIDVWNQKGKFLNTFSLTIKEKIIDSILIDDDTYCCLLSADDNHYLIKTFKLK